MEATTKTDRWFLRCSDCLTVVVVECARELRSLGWNRPSVIVEPASMECGACGGATEVMGRVHFNYVVTDQRAEVPEGCDHRCTEARGPSCDCPCGGVNHGSGLLVLIEKTGPTPKATTSIDPAKCLARACEYRAALAAAQARRDAIGKSEYERRMKGEWLTGRDYERCQDYIHASNEICQAKRLRTHKGRLARLAKIGM